ncbi:MAG TPA: hypothetical protein VF451_03320, partial [Acidobacteriota bacterium]
GPAREDVPLLRRGTVTRHQSAAIPGRERISDDTREGLDLSAACGDNKKRSDHGTRRIIQKDQH